MKRRHTQKKDTSQFVYLAIIIVILILVLILLIS